MEPTIELSTTLPEVTPPEHAWRSRRTRNRAVLSKAVTKRHLDKIIKRKRLFDSRTHAAFGDNGVVAISNNSSLTITTNITDVNNALWLMVPEISWYVDAVTGSNEYPDGSFFSSATARQNANNYDYFSVIKHVSSTDATIRWTAKLINRTGASANIGVVMGMRFVITTARPTATS